VNESKFSKFIEKTTGEKWFVIWAAISAIGSKVEKELALRFAQMFGQLRRATRAVRDDRRALTSSRAAWGVCSNSLQ